MDRLIELVNKLQDTFASIGVSNIIDLPQIVVIGSQSSGKSSVLENIVRRDFLPRGTGIVTRRPLNLQLINIRGKNSSMATKEGDDMVPAESGEEWGEFLHIPGKKFFSFDEIRQEIINDTEEKTGGQKGISNIPIGLRIFSPSVPTLTLVDLPGLTKVPIHGQPADIELQIRKMVLSYISKQNAIILAVTAANTDLANSDGLKLSREVDPDGIRTLGVLTKLDLMDSGTDAMDIIRGKVVPLRRGYIAVVNRGQRDIDGKKSIVKALEDEKMFFGEHPAYKSIAPECGTGHLSKVLSTILIGHIKYSLPDIKNKITVALQRYEKELATLGDSVEGREQNLILSIISEFCNDYRAILDGRSAELSVSELIGGARISYIFHVILSNAIDSIDAIESIKEVDIRTLLYNSSGSAPVLFATSAGFEVLTKMLIRKFEDPCSRCIQLVYDELTKILAQLLQRPAFQRFPVLKEKFYTSVIAFYKRCMEPTYKYVSSIVAAEGTYINTAHPDFLSGHQALAIVTESMKTATAPNGKNGKSSGIFPSDTPVGKLSSNSTVSSIFPMSDNNSIFSSFSSTKANKKKAIVMEAPPAVLKADSNLSEREYVEIEVIKILVESYISIVKKTMADIIPKAIMYHMVNFTKEEMQRALLADLYKRYNHTDLLREPESIVLRRQECRKMIVALQHAEEIVSTI